MGITPDEAWHRNLAKERFENEKSLAHEVAYLLGWGKEGPYSDKQIRVIKGFIERTRASFESQFVSPEQEKDVSGGERED